MNVSKLHHPPISSLTNDAINDARLHWGTHTTRYYDFYITTHPYISINELP